MYVYISGAHGYRRTLKGYIVNGKFVFSIKKKISVQLLYVLSITIVSYILFIIVFIYFVVLIVFIYILVIILVSFILVIIIVIYIECITANFICIVTIIIVIILYGKQCSQKIFAIKALKKCKIIFSSMNDKTNLI